MDIKHNGLSLKQNACSGIETKLKTSMDLRKSPTTVCQLYALEQHNDHAYFPYRRQIIQIDGIDYSCQRERNLNHKSKRKLNGRRFV